jgi:MORN repeat
MNGNGDLINPDGSKYNGDWEDGIIHGEGAMEY